MNQNWKMLQITRNSKHSVLSDKVYLFVSIQSESVKSPISYVFTDAVFYKQWGNITPANRRESFSQDPVPLTDSDIHPHI